MPINGPFLWPEQSGSYFAPPSLYARAAQRFVQPRREPEFSPVEEEEPQPPAGGWMDRLAGRLPTHGFNGMPQDAYKSALKAALIEAGASMIGRTEDPFTVLGEGLRTGLSAHRGYLGDEAQSFARAQQSEKSAADVAAQRAAVAEIKDPAQRTRLSRLVGSPEFWKYYADGTEPKPPEYRSGADDIIEMGPDGPKKVYDAPSAAQKPVKLGPGDVLIDPETREEIYSVPGKATEGKTITLSPGQIAFGPDGKEIARGGPKTDDNDDPNKFNSGKEANVRMAAKALYESALDAWKVKRRAAGLAGADEAAIAAWKEDNPEPREADSIQEAAEKMLRDHGYRSTLLNDPAPTPTPPPSSPVAGGPASSIERAALSSLEAEAAGWGLEDPGWAAAQFARLRAAGVPPQQAADAVREKYRQAKAAAGG